MPKTKYGKYILTKSPDEGAAKAKSALTPVVLEGLKDWGGIQHRLKWTFVSKSAVIEDQPHSHDFDEFLVFLGGDPANGLDFGAEVEVSLGKEGEKQLISTASIVCIPKGLVHSPIKFKKVSKTVLFCHIYTGPEYIMKPVK
jgi:hypothetical protein